MLPKQFVNVMSTLIPEKQGQMDTAYRWVSATLS